MLSILKENGEKRKVKLNLFYIFNNSLVVEIYNVNTANSTYFKDNENIFYSDENIRILSVYICM